MPHSPEAERAVLASILLDESVLRELSGGLEAEHFYQEAHRTIYAAALDLRDVGEPVDLRTVQAHLEQQGKLDSVGGVAYLVGLDLDLPDLGRVASYAGIVRARARDRRVLTAASRLVYSGTDPEYLEALQEALADHGQVDARREWSLRELLDTPELVELPEPRARYLAYPGRAVLLAGPEKLGKSTLMAHAVAAVTRGDHWLEEPTTGKSQTVLWATEEHPGDVGRRLGGLGADPDGVVVLQWGADPIGEIREAAERHGAGLVVVDTLAAVAEKAAPESGSASQWAAIMRPLVRMARELECALDILHHARRSDGQYRDSSEIGAAVDVIVELSGAPTARTRKLTWRGRYGRGEVTVELKEGSYRLLMGREDDGLQDEVLGFVRRHPGCSGASIERAVTSRASHVRQAVGALLTSGRMVDEGGAKGHEYLVREGGSGRGRDEVRDEVDEETSSASSAFWDQGSDEVRDGPGLTTSSAPTTPRWGAGRGEGRGGP